MIVRAGLAAFPYLSRRSEWRLAMTMLERVFHLDSTPETTATILPLARRAAAATAGSERELLDRGFLARLLGAAGRTDEAEAELRAVIAQAADRGDFRTASAGATDLINLLRDTGRLEPALGVAEEAVEYARRAGSGPWTQLGDEGQRLQILARLGRYAEVLHRVTELREEMREFPDPAGADDSSTLVWNVRETILDVGRAAALGLDEWLQALDLNAERLRSKAARGATEFEMAQSRFNDYGPLLHLRRYDEVSQLLFECQTVFQRENSVFGLSKLFSAMSDLADTRGQNTDARRFESIGLRFKYAVRDPKPAEPEPIGLV
jgi:tetratricopeptide (TPR) repeat protein